MTKLTNGTWVLVADGEKALFLENTTDEIDPFLKVVRLEEQDNPRQGEQTSDRPGRMPDSGAGHSSAMAEADWHQLAKDRFAIDLSEILLRLARRGAYQRLVIATPAKTLGALREKLHKEVASRVVAELSKDFTNHPISQIESLLKAELADL